MGVPGFSCFVFIAIEATEGLNGGELLNMLLLRNGDCSSAPQEVVEGMVECGISSRGIFQPKLYFMGHRHFFLMSCFDQSDWSMSICNSALCGKEQRAITKNMYNLRNKAPTSDPDLCFPSTGKEPQTGFFK